MSKNVADHRNFKVRSIEEAIGDNVLIPKESEFPVGMHKRWTVKDLTPYVWGDQDQYIDVGAQYDLYYVTNPLPARKYITVRTVGSGTSAGNIRHNKKSHRGFFQKAVTVRISHSGVPLSLEALAPQTENEGNMITVSTGIIFAVAGMIGLSSNVQLGIAIQYGKSQCEEL